MATTPAPTPTPAYRAGWRNNKLYFATLAEAAAHTAQHGGSVDKLCGTLYRTISGREQHAAEAESVGGVVASSQAGV